MAISVVLACAAIDTVTFPSGDLWRSGRKRYFSNQLISSNYVPTVFCVRCRERGKHGCGAPGPENPVWPKLPGMLSGRREIG
jgi:hypothetical protein